MDESNTVNRRTFLSSAAAFMAVGGITTIAAKSNDEPSQATDKAIKYDSVMECRVRLSKADAILCLELLNTVNDSPLWIMEAKRCWIVPKWTAKLIYTRWSPSRKQGERVPVRLRYHLRPSWDYPIHDERGTLLCVITPYRRLEHIPILRANNLIDVRMIRLNHGRTKCT